MAVTALAWNPLYSDLFAVGHGSCEALLAAPSCPPENMQMHARAHAQHPDACIYINTHVLLTKLLPMLQMTSMASQEAE